MNKIYEIVDNTDDEIYYPLGLFPTFELARSSIEQADPEQPISEYASDSDYEEISIFEREFGWTEHGRKVYKIERERVYDDKEDDFFWKVTKTETLYENIGCEECKNKKNIN
jgi:hypothetical protein